MISAHKDYFDPNFKLVLGLWVHLSVKQFINKKCKDCGSEIECKFYFSEQAPYEYVLSGRIIEYWFSPHIKNAPLSMLTKN